MQDVWEYCIHNPINQVPEHTWKSRLTLAGLIKYFQLRTQRRTYYSDHGDKIDMHKIAKVRYTRDPNVFFKAYTKSENKKAVIGITVDLSGSMGSILPILSPVVTRVIWLLHAFGKHNQKIMYGSFKYYYTV